MQSLFAWTLEIGAPFVCLTWNIFEQHLMNTFKTVYYVNKMCNHSTNLNYTAVHPVMIWYQQILIKLSFQTCYGMKVTFKKVFARSKIFP